IITYQYCTTHSAVIQDDQSSPGVSSSGLILVSTGLLWSRTGSPTTVKFKLKTAVFCLKYMCVCVCVCVYMCVCIFLLGRELQKLTVKDAWLSTALTMEKNRFRPNLEQYKCVNSTNV